MDVFYVYVIKDPRTGDPIYVGKGTGGRMRFHWWQMTADDKPIWNPKLRNKLTSIFRMGYTAPIYEKWFESTDERLCFWMERFWINVLGRENLCNLSDGGDGGFGHEVSIETREKLRIANTGKILSEEHRRNIGIGGTGKKQSEETKRKIGQSNVGKTANFGAANGFFGKKHTEETKRTIRESRIGKIQHPWSEASRQKLSATKRAKHAEKMAEKSISQTLMDL